MKGIFCLDWDRRRHMLHSVGKPEKTHKQVCDTTYSMCYNLVKGGAADMENWIVFVVVGLVVGLNLGYMVGIRRGSVIVGELLSGILAGFTGIANVVNDRGDST